MKKILLSLAVFFAGALALSAQNVKPYTELNTDKDDYAITFRSTCEGIDMWLTNYRQGTNSRSRRIVVARVDKAGFQAPVEAPYPINQRKDRGESDVYLDGSPCFNACNPNYGVFTSNRLHNGKTYDNDLYEMRKNGDSWTVRRLDEVNSDAWDDSPSLSLDGKFLYFASDRKRAGYGETDLYMATWLGDRWSSPVPLDDICELNIREQTPLAAPDGYLYYATDKSGDFDIWRVKLDEQTGKPISGTQEILPYAGVNKKGSSEGHPSFSPGLNWFIFSSNIGANSRDYNLHYTQINSGFDTIHIKSLIRTMKMNKEFEEYEDVVAPYSTKIMAKDLYTGQVFNAQTGDDGTAKLVLPRLYGERPANDRRIRELEVIANVSNSAHISSSDTLLYELGYSCKLQHTLYVWDSEVLKNPECKQNFPITDVEFFITGYWCPTTKKFADLTECQSVFPDPSCLEVPEIKQPCANNDLYTYKVTQPSIERIRRAGLCADLSEVSKHGSEWSAKVDTAIVKFVDNIRSALKKPCIMRSIKKNKSVTIEVIGWTDPRQIDMACLYTGKDIDFNTSAIKLYDMENRPYIKNGILKRNTKFRESANGGNQLLSEVRAYYTAELLDNLWKMTLPEYAELRAQGLIQVVAVGKSIKPDQPDMARQRSVNVRILTDLDEELANSKNRPELGSSIALCGNDCLINLVCRTIERTSKVNIEETLNKLIEPTEKQESETIDIDKALQDRVKEKKETKQAEPEKKSDAVTPSEDLKPVIKLEKVEEEKSVSSKALNCWTIRYCSYQDENAAKEVMAKLQGKDVKDVRLTVFVNSGGAIFYRVVAGCYQSSNDASSILRESKKIAKELGFEQAPLVIKE